MSVVGGEHQKAIAVLIREIRGNACVEVFGELDGRSITDEVEDPCREIDNV